MSTLTVQPQLLDSYHKEQENGEYIYTNRNFTFLSSKLDSSIKYIYDYSTSSLISNDIIYDGDPKDTGSSEKYFYDPDTGTWLNDIEINDGGEYDYGDNNDPGNNGDSPTWTYNGGGCSGGNCLISRIIAVNTNLKNTHIAISYTRKDGVAVSINKVINIINENIVVAIDSELQGGEELTYTATVYQYNEARDDLEVFDTKTGTIIINVNSSGNIIKLRFSGTPRSKYYFKINDSEEKWVTQYTDEISKTITVNFKTNIEGTYKLRIYSNDNYGTFKINDLDITGKTEFINCPNELTLRIQLTELNYSPDISEFGPRQVEVYSMNGYSYNKGGFPNQSLYMRKIQIYVDLPSSYSKEIENKQYTLYQECDFALPENQTAELDITDKNRYGWLNPAGGSFSFKVKAKCYWYIHSLVPSGFGIPNTCTFSPAEGGPNEWITVTMTWPAYDGPYRRDREIRICSIFNDQVICEKTYSGAGYYTLIKSQFPTSLINNPSGRSSYYSEGAPNPIINLLIFGRPRPLSGGRTYKDWTFTKEEGEVDVYFDSFVNYTVKSHPTWLHHTVKSAPHSENVPGPKVYTLRVDENNTGEERRCDFIVEVNDSRISGTDYITIVQTANLHAVEDQPYGYIKERAIIIPNKTSNLTLTVSAEDKWFIGSSTTSYGEYSTPFETGVNHNNPHPATITTSSIPQSNITTVWIGLFVFSQYLKSHYYSVWYILRDTVFLLIVDMNSIRQKFIIGGE